MPSRPSLQAWAKTVGPSPSMCSLNRMPGLAVATRAASVALRAGTAIEPHPPVALAGDDAEAVMLDLVQPIAAARQFVGFGWEAGRDEPGRQGTPQHNADS